MVLGAGKIGVSIAEDLAAGFVRQEETDFNDFTSNRFGRVFA
jgi:hypothetical protein